MQYNGNTINVWALAQSRGPEIGDHVRIGRDTCILGPVKAGDGAKIDVGAVVVRMCLKIAL